MKTKPFDIPKQRVPSVNLSDFRRPGLVSFSYPEKGGSNGPKEENGSGIEAGGESPKEIRGVAAESQEVFADSG